MGRLTDRVILITGSTEIAAAAAVRARSEGASIFIVSRTAEHARALAVRVDGGWAAANLEDEVPSRPPWPSGDADLCAFAGFGFETTGELDPAQTLTTSFRMANVRRPPGVLRRVRWQPGPDLPAGWLHYRYG